MGLEDLLSRRHIPRWKVCTGFGQRPQFCLVDLSLGHLTTPTAWLLALPRVGKRGNLCLMTGSWKSHPVTSAFCSCVVVLKHTPLFDILPCKRQGLILLPCVWTGRPSVERSPKSLLPCIGRSRRPRIQVPLTGDALLLQDTRAGMRPALSFP